MKERLEWELVPVVAEDRREEVEYIALEVLDLDAKLEIAPGRMTPREEERLVELQRSMSSCVVSPCKAAGAPLISSRPGWQVEASRAFEELDKADAVNLGDFLSYVGRLHDCSRCDGASRFPGVSGIPCDFDVESVLASLADGLRDRLQFEMDQEEMLALANDLERLHLEGLSGAGADSAVGVIEDMARFLRYWGGLGFGVAPAFVTAVDED